ncbi:putative glycoside hydrolase [uncultured Desulfosarcina sp.]|uniref:putative glycoside hydrolase n=1 Tax=uncultured Desulfosarcina sp. TaxID=218289 RepID=UPI0029C95C62|nr:putative glycoside hydrolase [uncultured Desulfosarcina sp.]
MAEVDSNYAVYVPPHKITQRTLDGMVHYASQTPINAVVLHVKTPRGRLLWPSKNPTAVEMGVAAGHSGLARHVARLKQDNIHTIAKLDVFADHQLAASRPDMSVIDARSGAPWTDANGLHWSNPSDSRVWAYNIALAKELAGLGFDEIQFDYVRFPSDGDLSAITYPNTEAGFSKSNYIQSFLEKASRELKPLGVLLSADIFGLTAWKTDDFGIGQVLEKMAPHLDVICPMFYPSHFPAGFLGKQSPGEFPEMIMEASMRSMQRRTDKPIRPWIQGFWYRPDQIAAQIEGIEEVSPSSWSVWSPSGNYGQSYRAMADRSGTCLTPPKFYATLAELKNEADRSIRGNSAVVNYTNFKSGYSIISLEAYQKGQRSSYTSPAAVVGTLEEGIMDHILQSRGISFKTNANPHTKRKLISDLLCSDLGKSARRMRPQPIYIDWSQGCTFSTGNIPKSRLELFAHGGREETRETSTEIEASEPINIAAISESIFGVVMEPMVIQPTMVFSR